MVCLRDGRRPPRWVGTLFETLCRFDKSQKNYIQIHWAPLPLAVLVPCQIAVFETRETLFWSLNGLLSHQSEDQQWGSAELQRLKYMSQRSDNRQSLSPLLGTPAAAAIPFSFVGSLKDFSMTANPGKPCEAGVTHYTISRVIRLGRQGSA